MGIGAHVESGVMYRTRYGHISEIDEKGAWAVAREFDPKLPLVLPDDPQLLKQALVSLARVVRELQHEWS